MTGGLWNTPKKIAVTRTSVLATPSGRLPATRLDRRAGSGQHFDQRGDVDVVALNVVALADNLAE